MTLTLEELKQNIIYSVCTNCEEQARFTPAEKRVYEKAVWNFRQGRIVSKTRLTRKPQRYRCNKCGAPTIFHNLATSQAMLKHRKEKQR